MSHDPQTSPMSTTSEPISVVVLKRSAPSLAVVPAEPERRPRPSVTYDDDLEWLLGQGDSAMGARGTLAGVVHQIERGSVGGSGKLDAAGSFTHTYTDNQLGIGSRTGIGDVEKHRWLSSAWRMVPPALQVQLCVRYSAPSAKFRTDSGFGARDRFVEGSDGKAGQHSGTRSGAEAQLGEFASLAFAVCRDPAALLVACIEPSPIRNGKANKAETQRRRALIRDSLRLAHESDAAAHGAWFEAKARAMGVRTVEARRGYGPGMPPVPKAKKAAAAIPSDAACARAVREHLAAVALGER